MACRKSASACSWSVPVTGASFVFPSLRFGCAGLVKDDLFAKMSLYRTAWDALGDLPEPDGDGLKVGGKWGDLLPTIPEGENYLWHTDRGGGKPLFGWRTRYWSFLLKLSKRLPSWTVQAQPGAAIGPFHWNNRKLTFQELCRIQTFPDGLSLDSGRTEMQRMMGNAVPSLIGEVLAREIRRQFFNAPLKSRSEAPASEAGESAAAGEVVPVPKNIKSISGTTKRIPALVRVGWR